MKKLLVIALLSLISMVTTLDTPASASETKAIPNESNSDAVTAKNAEIAKKIVEKVKKYRDATREKRKEKIVNESLVSAEDLDKFPNHKRVESIKNSPSFGDNKKGLKDPNLDLSSAAQINSCDTPFYDSTDDTILLPHFSYYSSVDFYCEELVSDSPESITDPDPLCECRGQFYLYPNPKPELYSSDNGSTVITICCGDGKSVTISVSNSSSNTTNGDCKEDGLSPSELEDVMESDTKHSQPIEGFGICVYEGCGEALLNDCLLDAGKALTNCFAQAEQNDQIRKDVCVNAAKKEGISDQDAQNICEEKLQESLESGAGKEERDACREDSKSNDAGCHDMASNNECTWEDTAKSYWNSAVDAADDFFNGD